MGVAAHPGQGQLGQPARWQHARGPGERIRGDGRLLRLGMVDASQAECQQGSRPRLQHWRTQSPEAGRGRRQQLRASMRVVRRPAGKRTGERGTPGIGGGCRGIGDEPGVAVISADERQARPADALQPLHAERLRGGDAGLDVRGTTLVASERPGHPGAQPSRDR